MREFSLRQVADHQPFQDYNHREREGFDRDVIPKKIMVCLASRGSGKKLLRIGCRTAGKVANNWFAIYVEPPDEPSRTIRPEAQVALQENLKLADELGAESVHLKGASVADELIKFVREDSVTHVIFGQSARSR